MSRQGPPAADAGGAPVPMGPGSLILVVGPSGAGKDTVIAHAQALLAAEERVLFARRLITRPGGTGEDHGTLSQEAFEAGRAADAFALSWRAHGLGYALGADVRETIRAGGLVLANGSRAVLPEARARFSHVKVVLVTAPAAVRAARLAARGREKGADIAERLARDPALSLAPHLIIENVGAPEEAGRRLADFVKAMLGTKGA